MNLSIITIDTDWAPDFIISDVADTLIRNKTKATWFITHDSEAIRALSDAPCLFEVGLHPNFRPDSTQGSTPTEIMKNLKEVVPDAVSVRTHGLHQSTSLLQTMRDKFGIFNDVSLLLPRASFLTPHRRYFTKDSYIVRLPYFWQDNEEALRPESSYSLKDDFHHAPGLKIYDFHPIHIALNMFDLIGYEWLKTHLGIALCTPSDIEIFKSKRRGSGSLFEDLIQHISGGYTIKGIARTWDEETKER